MLNFGDLDPQVADTYQYIAKVLAITGKTDVSLENFTKAIRIHEEILRWSPEPADDIPGFLQSLVRLSKVDVDLFKTRYGRLMECYEEGELNPLIFPEQVLVLDAESTNVLALLLQHCRSRSN